MSEKNYRIPISIAMQGSGANSVALARRAASDALTVLCYHRVLDSESPRRMSTESALVTSAHVFEHQMAIIARAFQPVHMSDVVEWFYNGKALPKRAILITFDDGWCDTYTRAFPIMRRFGIPGTVFLATAFVGTTRQHWADRVRELLKEALGADGAAVELERLKRMPSQERDIILQRIQSTSTALTSPRLSGENLTWGQVREMKQCGFEFGSHTCEHLILPHEPLDVIERELSESAVEIEKELSVRPESFAYPDGQYSPDICESTQRAGYKLAFTCDEGLCRHKSQPLAMPRLSVHDGVSTNSHGEFSSAVFMTYICGTIPWRYRRDHI